MKVNEIAYAFCLASIEGSSEGVRISACVIEVTVFYIKVVRTPVFVE